MITLNCCQIDFLKLLRNGFSTGHGHLREPSSIRAYAALACVAVQSNQNDQFGGQSINCFDYAMAEGVRKTFRKALISRIRDSLIYLRNTDIERTGEIEVLKKNLTIDNVHYSDTQCDEFTKEYFDTMETVRNVCGLFLVKYSNCILSNFANTYELACRDTVEETHQAMEALIHNFNSLHSRAGSQVPFSSINFGMDTSQEGRLVIREVLTATWNGLGHGETPIFPISVFQLMPGVNYNPGDPNYDLFKYACKVSAKRLFPNFLNLGSSFNFPYYKPGDYNSYVATMGCRTRVMSNVNGPEESGSRGNFSFVTINLPMLALEAKGDLDKFWELYDKYIQISHDYLLYRFEIIANKHVYNFPFLMGQGVWMGSDKLKPTDTIRDVLKHASYSIGYCGLAECLVALIGKHHGESEEAQELGLKIIGHLREMTDKYTKDEQWNWTTFASPAEATAGGFLRATRKKFGVIPGVTDHEYFSNSNHVPPYYKIRAIDKIRIEAPYHALANAGNISYIEMDGDPLKNLSAFETLVRAMVDADMGYISINHSVDRDPVCGYTGIIENECPHCHRREDGHYHFIMDHRPIKKEE